jgi:hypothetical protein
MLGRKAQQLVRVQVPVPVCFADRRPPSSILVRKLDLFAHSGAVFSNGVGKIHHVLRRSLGNP